MKNIKYIIAALVAAGLTTSSYGVVTVVWSTSEDTYLSDSGGAADAATELAPGDALEIGTFAINPTIINAGNLVSLLSSFWVFGSGSINEGPGAFALASQSTAGPFTGTQIFMIAFNAAAPTAATQWAIFDENDTVNTSWKMPADNSSTAIDPGDLFVNGGNTVTGPVLGPGAQILWGAADFYSDPFSLIDTEPVPEPSSVMLVVTGLLGLFALRRRN
jgi:hypothetical protein